MIKIHEKIWFVIKPKDQDNLAYMCPYAETLEGKPDSKTASMQSTGRGWAIVFGHATKTRKEGSETVTENSPQTGFYVGSSVSRWSTSNKLFRVKDPRGFTVEIPTDNLATLLHHTTVVKGVVQEECVWGREGNNHILLPVNSQPYLDTLDKMDVLENKLISIKELKKGDIVKFFENDREYQYVGKVKATWSITPQSYNRAYYTSNRGYDVGETKIVEDEKWTDLFVYTYTHTPDKFFVETKSKPKIVSVLRNEEVPESVLQCKVDFWWPPDRVTNKVTSEQFDRVKEYKLLSIKVKE